VEFLPDRRDCGITQHDGERLHCRACRAIDRVPRHGAVSVAGTLLAWFILPETKLAKYAE
jgi:hypothetical protein